MTAALFAQTCRNIVSTDATRMSLDAYCDPRFHALPTSEQNTFKQFATPQRLLDCMIYHLSDETGNADEAAAALAGYLRPTSCAAHLEHYLLDITSIHDGDPHRTSDDWYFHGYLLDGWHQRLATIAHDQPRMADDLAAIATTREDGPARAALSTLFHMPNHPCTRATCKQLLAQPASTVQHATPQDDLILAILDSSYPQRACTDTTLTRDLAERAITQDRIGTTSGLVLAHVGKQGSPADTQHLLAIAREKMDRHGFEDAADVCKAPAWCPRLLQLSAPFAVDVMEGNPTAFYDAVAALPSPLPAETITLTCAAARERDSDNDRLWLIANGQELPAITTFDDIEYVHRMTARDLYAAHTTAFLDRFGAEDIMNYFCSVEPHARVVHNATEGIVTTLHAINGAASLYVDQVVSYINEHDSRLADAQRDALLAALMHDSQ